jgi:hypothetical protein
MRAQTRCLTTSHQERRLPSVPCRGDWWVGLTSRARDWIVGWVPSSAFTPASVLPVLEAACDQAGFSSYGAELLRIGENAIWRLGGEPIVVRIARTIALRCPQPTDIDLVTSSPSSPGSPGSSQGTPRAHEHRRRREMTRSAEM